MRPPPHDEDYVLQRRIEMNDLHAFVFFGLIRGFSATRELLSIDRAAASAARICRSVRLVSSRRNS
jgi:hypothetical protein